MGALKCDYCGRDREDSQIHRVRGGFLYCRDHGDCREYVRRGEFVALGQKIIDTIISAKLVSAQCAENREHGVVCVWSANAAEQLGAIVKETLKRRL